MNDLLNSVEVQQSLGISRQALYTWIKEGRLVAQDRRGIAGTLLFARSDVEAARADRAADWVAQLEKLGYTVTLELVRK